MEQLWRLELDQVTQEYGREPDPELWRWSPLEIWEFSRMLNVARDLAVQRNVRLPGRDGGMRRITFAEAGCGIGTKLYLARNWLKLDETGFEIDDYYLSRCAELGVNAVQCDLREPPGPPWVMFDIVYLSRPFKDDGEEVAWERCVMDALRPGAVLMSAYAAVKPYTWPCYYRMPFRGVWIKPGNVTTPVFDRMVQRTGDGPDPLVREPGPGP